MTDLNLDVAKKVDYNRKFQLETLRSKYPELFIPGAPPEEHLLELLPFFFEKPQMFYNELVFENALAYLTNYYAKNANKLHDDFTYVAEEVRRGAIATAYYSRDIENNPTDQIDREVKIRRYWCPWYQNLEVCLKEVCSPWFWAVAQNKNERSRLEDSLYMDKRQRTLDKEYSLSSIGECFNSIVRNGCAHGGVTLLSEESILFRDAKGNHEEWTDTEFLMNIHGMLDICNALIFASKIFIFRNWTHLSNIFSYQALPANEREAFFLTDASTPSIEVQRIELRTVINSQLQVTIEAVDNALVREELLVDALVILQRIPLFYPEADTVFLGIKGPRHMPSWIRVPMTALQSWVNGNINDQAFFKTQGLELIVFPYKKLLFAQKFASIRRGFVQGSRQFKIAWRKAMNPKQQAWKILEVQDKSIGQAKRLDVTLLIPEGLSREEIEPMLIAATNYIREKRYWTQENKGFKPSYRKYYANRPAGYVWLTVFTKEKRASDMWANKDFSYYVCRTEWFDGDLRSKELEPILGLTEHCKGSDISVEWSSHS